MWAAEKGHAHVCEVLLEHGASLDTISEPAGHTALHMVGQDQQCPLQAARATCDLLLRHWADTTLVDRFGATPRAYHLRCDSLSSGRDGRGAQLASLIASWEHNNIKMLAVMQRLCWLRLLNRHPNDLEFSHGYNSPAFALSLPKVSVYGHGNGNVLPMVGGFGEVLAIHICRRVLSQPTTATLTRHLHGMRDSFYTETLPSFQLA